MSDPDRYGLQMIQILLEASCGFAQRFPSSENRAEAWRYTLLEVIGRSDLEGTTMIQISTSGARDLAAVIVLLQEKLRKTRWR